MWRIFTELREIAGLLRNLREEFKNMSDALNAELDEVKTELVTLKTVDTSAIALINGITKMVSDAIANASDDSAAVAAVNDVLTTIKAQDASLAAAVVANTPAAPPVPAPPVPVPAPPATP